MPLHRDSLDPQQKKRHLAALEALFAPRPAFTASAPSAPTSSHSLAKMVSATSAPEDPERTRLVARLLGADGTGDAVRATSALERAGYEVPRQQEAQLQMLQHTDERRVRTAIATLAHLFDTESPRRRPVLEGRLRRLEDLAEEPETRDAATALRRRMVRPQA